MWLSRQMKAPAPTADADLGMTTITGAVSYTHLTLPTTSRV